MILRNSRLLVARRATFVVDVCFFGHFLAAPSLRAERLFWSLWRVSVHPVVRLYLTDGPPPLKIIGSQKFQNQNLFQLILSNISGDGGPHPPPVKGKIFDTGFGLIHIQTGKKNFFPKNFFSKIFFCKNF